MEQKKNLRIWMILLGVLVAFLVVLLVLLWRVSAQQPPETEPIETTQPAADLQQRYFPLQPYQPPGKTEKHRRIQHPYRLVGNPTRRWRRKILIAGKIKQNQASHR